MESVEVAVNEILQSLIQMRNLHIELNEITIEFVTSRVQKLMVLTF